jgi:hypothetical protein
VRFELSGELSFSARSGGKLALTSAGRQYLEVWKNEERALGTLQKQPKGLIRVVAVRAFGHRHCPERSRLRDAKIKPLVETFNAAVLDIYARACGWVLARAVPIVN